jgi:hypothetical protein
VARLVGAHAFAAEATPVAARRFLAQYGDELALDLAEHRLADLRAKEVPPEWLTEAEEFRRLLEAERDTPHRLSDLALGGAELLELGIPQGPEIGRTLDELLGRVVDEPELNTRERLLELAEELR